MRLRRRKPELEPSAYIEPSAHIWNLDNVVRDVYQKRRTMQQGKIRSTDYPGRFTPLKICTTPAEARQAALSSVSLHCLDCNTTFPGDHVTMPNHDCRNPITGADNAILKRARADMARRELQALKNYPAPPCVHCKADMPPGVVHTCSLAHEPLPHELAAAAWQRKGAAALAAELEEIKAGGR